MVGHFFLFVPVTPSMISLVKLTAVMFLITLNQSSELSEIRGDQ